MLKKMIAILLIMMTEIAYGQEFCVRPVFIENSTLNAENKQPNLLLNQPNIIPGYPGFVFHSPLYPKLLHFNGKELLEIKDDFPHIWLYAYKSIFTDHSGNSYGFGSDPRGFFYLPKDGQKWQVIDDPKEYQSVHFDEGSGTVYFLRDGIWERMQYGKVIGKVDMPNHNKDAFISDIRSVPELSGVFVITRPNTFGQRYKQSNQSLWFKPDIGDWQKIDIPVWDEFNVLLDLDDSTFEVSDTLVRIFRGGRRAPLFLSRTLEGLKFQSVGHAGTWRKHTESGAWWAWIGEKTQKIKNKPVPPKLFLLPSGETIAEEIKDFEPYSLKGKLSIIYSGLSEANDALGHSFLRGKKGLIVFNGIEFLTPKSLRYTNIGKTPRIHSLNETVFIQSRKGVFRLSPEFEVTPIKTFPITEPLSHLVEINYFEHADRFLISDGMNNTFFTSPDMKTFTQLANKEKSRIINAVLQDPPTALVGSGGDVHMITQECSISE